LFYPYGLIPLIPFVIAGSAVEKKAIAARIADYLDKEFKNVKLSKDDSTHGFIYFMPSNGSEALKGKLVLNFVDETDGSDFVVRVPLE